MKKLLFIGSIILISHVARSQVETQLLPSDLKQQTIVTESVTLRKGFFRTGLAMSYGVVDKYFDDAKKRNYVSGSSWGSSSLFLFTFQYGISNRLMIDFSTPVNSTKQVYNNMVVSPENNLDFPVVADLKGSGIGDCYLTIKYQIIPEEERKMSLTGSLDLTLPTGEKNPTEVKSYTDYQLPAGNGFLAIGTRVSARRVQYPFSYTAYVGYNYKLKGSRLIFPTDLEETEFKDGNAIETGGSFNLHLNEWIALANELNYYYRGEGVIMTEPDTKIDPAWAFSYESRLVFQIKQFRLGEAVRVPLIGKNVSADPLYVLLVQYIF
jgi:hypothetical protein